MSGQRCLSCIGRYKDFICIKKQFHFLFTCFMKTFMISMPADWTGKFIWRCPGLDSLSSVFTFLQQNIVIWKIRVWRRGAVFGALAGMSRTVFWLDNLKVSRVFGQCLLWPSAMFWAALLWRWNYMLKKWFTSDQKWAVLSQKKQEMKVYINWSDIYEVIGCWCWLSPQLIIVNFTLFESLGNHVEFSCSLPQNFTLIG